MYTIKITTNTTGKLSTAQADQLPDTEKASIPAGEYPLHSYSYDRATRHYRVAFGKDSSNKQISFGGKNTFYVWQGHAEIYKNGEIVSLVSAGPTQSDLRDSFLLLRWTGEYDEFSAKKFRLEWRRDKTVLDWVYVVSGQPGLSGVLPKNDYSGSNRPCPEGKFSLGPVEENWSPYGWGAGLGNYWVSINGTSPRGNVGIHNDANRYTQDGKKYKPGSAGCVCPTNQRDTQRVMGWVDGGAKYLIVDWQLGSVTYPK